MHAVNIIPYIHLVFLLFFFSLSLIFCHLHHNRPLCQYDEKSLKVQEVQKAGEEMVKSFEAKIEQKLSQKMETYEVNRQNQLKGMLAKLQEHVSASHNFVNISFC